MKYLKTRLNRNFLALLIGDVLIINASFYLSILFRFDFNIPFEIKSILTYKFFIGLLFVKLFCFRLFALYRGMWRYTSVWDMINIVKANILSSAILITVILFSIGFEYMSRSLFIIDFMISTGFISISRLGIRMFFSYIKKATIIILCSCR